LGQNKAPAQPGLAKTAARRAAVWVQSRFDANDLLRR